MFCGGLGTNVLSEKEDFSWKIEVHLKVKWITLSTDKVVVHKI